MTESVIMRLDKVSIVRVLRDEPTFSEFFMRHLLARNARVEEDPRSAMKFWKMQLLWAVGFFAHFRRHNRGQLLR